MIVTQELVLEAAREIRDAKEIERKLKEIETAKELKEVEEVTQGPAYRPFS